MDHRKYLEHLAIVEGLRTRRCRCKWLFVSVADDRYRYKGNCKEPCQALKIVLARINTA